jgi:hypothetical protein
LRPFYYYIYNYDSPNGLSPHETYLEFGGVTDAKNLYLFLIYYDHDFTPRLTTAQRNNLIRERYAAGEKISELARAFGISPQRIFQIVRGRNV